MQGNQDPADASKGEATRGAVASYHLNARSGFGVHPVLNNNIRLPTPAIRAAFDIVGNTALQRAPGCCFFAHPRFGKTFAIEVLRAQLAQTFPLMPTYAISAKFHGRFSEGVLLGELLVALTHVLPSAGKVEPRWGRLVNVLWTQAQSNGSDRVMLFVDEAQNWHESELTLLRDLSNQLALEHGVQLMAVFFGTPEIVTVRNALIESGRIDLIGRFMIQQHEFHGILTLDELLATMSCYDDPKVSEYPLGSGRSYSEFLLSRGYQHGWRLQHEGASLWEAFKSAAQQSGGLSQVGMQWVSSSIREFFLGQLEYDHADLKGTADDWKNAVMASGFQASLGVTYLV